MPRTKRKHYTPEQKAAIVRRHLVDKVPVSQLCEEAGIQPSVFYGWQKQVLENLEAMFANANDGRSKRAEHAELARERQRVAALEAKLARKDRVIAELTEELIEEKKSAGES